MEQQDLLNALKGKRLHWRDEDNENDGVIEYITTTKEGEYLLLFDDFAQVAMDKWHIETLATTGHTCDSKYSYNLDKPPINYVREALLGKRFAYGNEDGIIKGIIEEIDDDEETDRAIVYLRDPDDAVFMRYWTIHKLIATGESSDECFSYTLLEDEPNTTLNTTTTSNATTTSGDIVYSDGIDWEGRTWGVFRHLYLVDEIDAETALENARGMVEIYRKATEGKV